jgi:hypothetical protein
MTSMAQELKVAPPMTAVVGAFEHRFRETFGYPEATVMTECHA